MTVVYILLAAVFLFLSVHQSRIPDRRVALPQAYPVLYALTAAFVLAAMLCPVLDGWQHAFALLAILRWLFRVGWIFLLGMAVFVAVYPYLPGVPRARGTEKVMLVLGAPVLDGRPSGNLLSRADKAAEYLTAHPETDVILSGGKPCPITEAQAMLDRMRDMGAPDARVRLEEHSLTTRENLKFSRPLLEAMGYSLQEPLIVVTNEFHFFRMRYSARKYGYTCLRFLPAPTPKRNAPICFFSEALLTIQYWLLKHN